MLAVGVHPVHEVHPDQPDRADTDPPGPGPGGGVDVLDHEADARSDDGAHRAREPGAQGRPVGVDATDLGAHCGPATQVGVPVPDLVGGGGAPGTDRQGGHAGQTTERPAARQTGAMTTPGGARAGIVVTGTEVLTGRVADRNGPWLAEQLRLRGVDIAHVIVVGDRPEDLRSSLAFLAASGLDLVITTGASGRLPTT